MRRVILFFIASTICSHFFAQTNNSDDNKLIIKGYLNELQTLNDYLEKNNWKSGCYGKVTVNENTVSISYDLKANYSFKASEIDKAFVDNNKKVILKCKEESNCIYDYVTKQYTSFIVIDEKNQKDKIKNTIAELFNSLISKINNSPTRYAETPLEIAIVKLNKFLKNKPANHYYNASESYLSYFDKVYMEGKSNLTFEYTVNGSYYNKDAINLENVIEFAIENVANEKPKLNIYLTPNKYSVNNFYDLLGERLSNSDVKNIYVLLGNVLDAYRTANDKHYKVEQTYQDRVDLMNAPTFLEKIEKESIIRIDDNFKKNDDYKKVKKLIGNEVTVEYLEINHDYQTYRGKIKVNNEKYYVEEIKITFIKDKDGNDLAAYKAKLEGKAKQDEQNKAEADDELYTHWHPVSALIYQFVKDAKYIGGLSKYVKQGKLLENPSNPNSTTKLYDIDKYHNYTKCLNSVTVFENINTSTDDKLKRKIVLYFPEKYLDRYKKSLEHAAPTNGSSNPDNIFWKQVEGKGLVLFYKGKIPLMAIYNDNVKNYGKGIKALEIFEYVE